MVKGELHLWSANLDLLPNQIESLWTLLNQEEKSKVMRLRIPLKRVRALVAKATLRKLLAQYLSIAPETVTITYQPTGKPILPESELHFNLSHSGGLAVFTFSQGHEVGIDIEKKRHIPNVLEIAKKHFTPEETEALKIYATKRPNLLEEAFLSLWTRKEAWLKAIGTGLQRPLDTFCVSGPETPPNLFSINGDPEEANKWWMSSYEPNSEYVGTVVLKGKPCKVNSYHY